ncbi:MAG TPA: S8 family serine peptidase [Longimicrobiaceae bacterium]|nr:S8 family serine peptidase [Longimicrobiaceae bacterium]
MKRLTVIAASALVLAGCQDTRAPFSPEAAPELSAGQAGAPNAGEYVAGQILVRFRAGVNRAQVAAAHGASVQRELNLPGIFVLSVAPGRELAVVSALSRNPNVEFAEPDYIRTHGVICGTGVCEPPSDTYFGYKWDLHNDGDLNNSTGAFVVNTGKADADTDWLEAYQQLGAITGSAVIGIVDTGVLSTHPDLVGRVLAGYDFVNNDADPNDDDGHGTHVAGIAAGLGNDVTGVTGVAYGPNIKVLPVKVCGPSGCPTSAIVNGIKFAADNGAHAINLSLGGRFGSTSEQQALQYALSKNSLPFCATGNDGSPRNISYPAKFPECVAVGATNWSDGRAGYSNAGPEIDISAPGGDSENANGYSYILSAYNSGGYVFMAGTSMATPQAAGLAGLLHATGVTGASNIRSRIESTVDDLGSAGWDKYFGKGRINIYRAINNITS